MSSQTHQRSLSVHCDDSTAPSQPLPPTRSLPQHPSTPPPHTSTTATVASNKKHKGEVFSLLTPGKLSYSTPRESFNLLSYLKVEMFGIGVPGDLEPPGNENIKNFLLVPYQLECLLSLGFVICLDAFLYVLTYLPIRIVFSSLLLLREASRFILLDVLGLTFLFNGPVSAKKKHSSSSRIRFHRTQGYDLMRGAMLVISTLVLRQINMSQTYHYIRQQNMVKLYVLTSMMEVLDKLFSSFGQDAFDALHNQTRSNPRSLGLLLYFLVACSYVTIHSILYFFEVATMTVIINSESALLTVLVLNNFAELKSFVFKKFDCNNLFQLACSDITERFQMTLFLSLILLEATAQNGFTGKEVSTFAQITLLTMVGESIADSMKHAFINKFNSISARVYKDFAFVLRSDILSNQKDEIILDHTYSVTRRLGLSQIPLGCVCIRYIILALSAPSAQLYLSTISRLSYILHGVAIFCALVVLKIFVGVCLYLYADYAQRKETVLFEKIPATVSKLTKSAFKDQSDKATVSNIVESSDSNLDLSIQERIELVEDLSNIERYTVYKGRIL